MFTTILPAIFMDVVTLNHTIEFVSRVCVVDFSTWTYNFTSGSSPSISHWVIAWCGGSAPIIYLLHPNGVEYGIDPMTGVHGINFSVGFEAGKSAIFWFTLDECYEASDVEVAIKPGGNTLYSAVTCPIFSYSITLDIEGEGPDSTYMKAVAEMDYSLINTMMFYWYGSFESDGEAGLVEDPMYIAVDSDGSDGFEAYHQVTVDDLGYWYVKAEF